MFKAAALSPLVSQRLVNFTMKPDRDDLLFLKERIEAGEVEPVIDRTYEGGHSTRSGGDPLPRAGPRPRQDRHNGVTALVGFGSGSRIIRNELNRPRMAARSGRTSAT